MTASCPKCPPSGAGLSAIEAARQGRRLAVVGLPNAGKSTFFNRLTGLSQRVGNWPGLTIDLASAKVVLGARAVEVVDLPGIHDLSGYSEDEAVVREVLAGSVFDGLVVVVNGAQLDRHWRLVWQLAQLDLPLVVLVNMQDEMRQLGIRADLDALSVRLGAPVLAMSARKGENWPAVRAALTQLAAQIPAREVPVAIATLDALPAGLEEARAMLAGVHHVPATLPATWTTRIDQLLLHPWLGLPMFTVLMALIFQATYLLGTPMQEGLGEGLDWVQAQWWQPALASAPAWLRSLLLEGVWQGVSTVLTFIPILFVFFVLMAIVEDSGYLARAAFLMDASMTRLGLDGRSFVMHLMGFGCNVPAILGTRIMRERRLRWLTMLVIPFSVCSARLQVFLFFVSTLFSAQAAPWVLLSLYLASFLVAMLTAWLFKRALPHREALVMEMPPYRLPVLAYLFTRAGGEVKAFLQLASTFILAGVVLIWALTHLPAAGGPTLAAQLGEWLAPVLDPLGIRHELAVALMVGVVAKEILLGGMAVIYGVPEAGLAQVISQQLDWVAAYSFMLFTLIYTPCLSTIAAIRKESRSNGFAALSVGYSLALAWCVAALFYQGARWWLG